MNFIFLHVIGLSPQNAGIAFNYLTKPEETWAFYNMSYHQKTVTAAERSLMMSENHR